MRQLLGALGILLTATAILIAMAFEFSDRPRSSSVLENITVSALETGGQETEVYELEGEASVVPGEEPAEEGDPAAEFFAEQRRELKTRLDRLERRRAEYRDRAPDDQGYLIVLVEPGDTFRTLARRHLGDASLWREIAAHNRTKVRLHATLEPGTRLKIPLWLTRSGEPEAPPSLSLDLP